MQHEDEPLPEAQTGAAGHADWLDVVVPNDPRELEPDLIAYRRELRARRRHERFERLVLVRWRRLGVVGPLILGLLVAVTAVGSLLLMSLPRPDRNRPIQQPVAPDGSSELVPDVRLDSGDVTIRLRAMRPAIVALVPENCDCARLLDTLAGEAQEFRLDLLAVGPAGSHDVFDLVRKVRRGTAVPLVDNTGQLVKRYAPVGVTALVLAPDATVRAVVRASDEHTRLEPYLSAVLEPTLRAR